MPRKREARLPASSALRADTSSNPPQHAPEEPNLELELAQSTHSYQLLCASEEARKLRCQSLLRKHDADVTNEQLLAEQLESQRAQSRLEEVLSAEREAQARLDTSSRELLTRAREIDLLKAELDSLQNVSADSAKHIAEKLASARELASLKPELEHLRSQVSANEGLISEKLALQQQLKETQAELSGERRAMQRLKASESRQHGKDEQLSDEIERLKSDLATAQQELALAEATATKKDAATAALEKLKAELASEKRTRQKAESEAAKITARAAAEWEAEKAVLDDKLDQFRTKLRSTKERLKQAEAELSEARDAAAHQQQLPEPKASKNPRKRTAAAAVDPDAAIGTPGDATKRPKRSSALGEKSTFSITPFLNRTSNATTEDPADVPVDSIEDVMSPSERVRAHADQASPNALGPAPASKTNTKGAPATKNARKRPTGPSLLEQVAEEEDEGADENAVSTGEADDDNTGAKGDAQRQQQKPKPKPVLKPRKSIAAFASFREASLQPGSRAGSVQPQVLKKKRKLLGASAKTLFDEDDDEDAGAPSNAGLGGFGAAGRQRAFGALNSLRGGLGGGLLGRKKEPTQVSNGFAFSPLKKERRAMREAASRATSEAPGA